MDGNLEVAERTNLTRPAADFETMPEADCIAALAAEGTMPLRALLDGYARRAQAAFLASRAALAESEELAAAKATMATAQTMTRRIEAVLDERERG